MEPTQLVKFNFLQKLNTNATSSGKSSLTYAVLGTPAERVVNTPNFLPCATQPTTTCLLVGESHLTVRELRVRARPYDYSTPRA